MTKTWITKSVWFVCPHTIKFWCTLYNLWTVKAKNFKNKEFMICLQKTLPDVPTSGLLQVRPFLVYLASTVTCSTSKSVTSDTDAKFILKVWCLQLCFV